jgi:c-di-GMP-binding flagellar brake protein YcgR
MKIYQHARTNVEIKNILRIKLKSRSPIRINRASGKYRIKIISIDASSVAREVPKLNRGTIKIQTQLAVKKNNTT